MVENDAKRVCEIQIDGISFRMQSVVKTIPCILSGRKCFETGIYI